MCFRSNRIGVGLLLCLFIVPVALFGGGSQEPLEPAAEAVPQPAGETTVPVQIVVPTGVPAISVSHMASGALTVDVPGYETSIEVVASPDVMGARLVSGEADIAIVPTNLGARLYNQEVPVQLAGVVVWGILYVVSAEPIESWDQLRGREIGMLGRGLTPDIVFRYLAQKNGLEPDRDFSLRYVNASTELAPNFITGATKVSIMPEPMLTMVMSRAQSATIAFDLQEEWARVSDSGRPIPQASLVISTSFAEDHSAYVAEFLDVFAESVSLAVGDPAAAAEHSAAMMPQLSAPLIEKAMPRTNLEFVDSLTARPAVEEYLRVLGADSPNVAAGSLPGDDFYYVK